MSQIDIQSDTLLRHGAFLRVARVFVKEAQYELIKLVRERAYVLSVIGLPIVFFLVFDIAANAARPDRTRRGRCHPHCRRGRSRP